MSTWNNCEKWVNTLALALLENTFPQSKNSIMSDDFTGCKKSNYESITDFFECITNYIYEQITDDNCSDEFKFVKENAQKFCEKDDPLNEHEMFYAMTEIMNDVFPTTKSFDYEDSQTVKSFYKNATKALCLIIYDYQLGKLSEEE